MRYWVAGYLAIAVAAGILGFGGVIATMTALAKVLFVIFLVVFLVALALAVARRRAPPSG
jgi:uncharacterized membrane protein YtjA (UPF0391 family)